MKYGGVLGFFYLEYDPLKDYIEILIFLVSAQLKRERDEYKSAMLAYIEKFALERERRFLKITIPKAPMYSAVEFFLNNSFKEDETAAEKGKYTKGVIENTFEKQLKADGK